MRLNTSKISRLLENWPFVRIMMGMAKKIYLVLHPVGIKVFKNTSKGGVLAFFEVANPLFSEGFSGKINSTCGLCTLRPSGMWMAMGMWIFWHLNRVDITSSGIKICQKEMGKSLGLVLQKFLSNKLGGFLHKMTIVGDILFTQK
jgi:hypothetical protein